MISIRVAEKSDARPIAVIHTAAWQKIYRGSIPDTVLDHLSVDEREKKWLHLISTQVKIFLIEHNKLIVGFASICTARDTDPDLAKCGEISALYLHPDYWRIGLGTKLCSRACIELKDMGFNEVIVWVLKENTGARNFYESLGFKDTGKTKKEEYSNHVILSEVCYKK